MLPETKNFIYNIITRTDEVDEKGKNVVRSTFNKKHLRGYNEIKNAVINQIEIGLADKKKKIETLKPDDIEWVPQKDFTPPADKQIVAERHTEGDIKLSDTAKEALKHYYDEREEVPPLSDEALTEFESLIK